MVEGTIIKFFIAFIKSIEILSEILSNEGEENKYTKKDFEENVQELINLKGDLVFPLTSAK